MVVFSSPLEVDPQMRCNRIAGWLLAAVMPALAGDRVIPQTADQLLEAGHYKQARTLAEADLRKNPKDSHALYLLSRTRLAMGDSDGALDFAKKAVTAAGNNPEYLAQLGNAAGDKAQNAGWFEKLRLASLVKDSGSKALQLDPNNLHANQLMFEFYWKAPGIAGGDKDKAREIVNTILRLDPVEGNLYLAEMALLEKKNDQVESYYAKAVSAGAKNYKARIALASFYAGGKDDQSSKAEKEAREAVNIDRQRAGAYAVLALLYAKQKRWAELDAALAEAEKNVPDNLNPMYQAGRILLGEGSDLPRAEKYFRKYLTQEPEGGSPHLAAAHWRLGLVLEKMGRKPEAKAEIETAVRLKPDFKPAQEDLRRLK